MVMVITATVNKSDYDNMLRTYWLKEDIDADLEVDGVEYKKGEIAFRDLLDTEKQLLDLQLMSAQAEQQRWNAYHQILAASGQPYPGMKKDQ